MSENEARITNAEFAKTDKEFLKACANAGCHPTAKQASKWRNHKGRAWREGR